MRRYMADLVIGFLQTQLAAAVLFPPTPADAARAALPLPEPMLPGNVETRGLACLHDDALRAAARPSAAGVRPDWCSKQLKGFSRLTA